MGIPLTENDLDDLRVLTPQLVVKGVDIPRKTVACFFAIVIDPIAGRSACVCKRAPFFWSAPAR